MLILMRRVNESIIIGDHTIDVKVLGIKGHQGRLGINAPKDIPIHREEIFQRIQQQKEEKEKSV